MVKAKRGPEDAALRCIWENVTSMPMSYRIRVTQELREVEPNMELVAIDARGMHWSARDRIYWTNFYVPKLDDEIEESFKQLRCLYVTQPLERLEDNLEDGARPSWFGNESKRFHTFTRPWPVEEQPRQPNGLATATAEARARWEADSFRYSPYQYEDVYGVFDAEGNWRKLTGNERANIYGFPKGYLTPEALRVPLTEDEKCTLIGDTMALGPMARIMAAIPEVPGVWPPYGVQAANGHIEVTRSLDEAEIEPEAADWVPRVQPAIVGKLVHSENLTEEAAARLKLAGMSFSKLEDEGFGIVRVGEELQVRRAEGARAALPHLWTLPIFRQEYIDGFEVATPESSGWWTWTLPAGTDRVVLASASRHRGGRLIVADETEAKSTTTAMKVMLIDVAGMREIELSQFEAGTERPAFVIGYRFDQRKGPALLGEARREGLYPWQPERPDITPGNKSIEVAGEPAEGKLGLERWRLRAAQGEDEDLKGQLILLERGEREVRKTLPQREAELVIRDGPNFVLRGGLLHRTVTMPDGDKHTVPVIPHGGARSVEWNGAKRVLTWRNLIFAHLAQHDVWGAHHLRFGSARFGALLVARFSRRLCRLVPKVLHVSDSEGAACW